MLRVPRVSICVPNLNTRPFLSERFETIFAQTFQDWELLVYDSYSDDGAWEYLNEMMRREPRMRLWQGPRQGTPGSWNPCIAAARGEFVYIATSDDTMAPDCVEKLVAALDRHPECDVAHCLLRAFDEHGHDVEDVMTWWSHASLFARSSGPLLHRPHVRRAPFDGLLHLRGESVCISITQLLIRRSLFARIGMFESRWNSVGDFNWNMRAGLVANSVHVPDTWGGWRVHQNQATAKAGLDSPEHSGCVEEMISHAIATSGPLLPPKIRARLGSEWRSYGWDFRRFERELKVRRPTAARRRFIARQLCAGSPAAREYVKSRLRKTVAWQDSFPESVARWLERADIRPVLVPEAIGAAAPQPGLGAETPGSTLEC